MNEEQRTRERYRTVFGTTAGQAVLSDLRDQFSKRTLAVSNAHDTTVNAAQADVVRYVLDMIGLPDD